MELLPYREDFWPKDFEEYKLASLVEHPTLKDLTLEHICAVFEILQTMIQKQVGASKI
jgi:hypothetical protein